MSLDVVFTTKGVNNLLKSLDAIGKRFDALDAKMSTGNGVNKGAKDMVLAATYVSRSADALNRAAANLKQAATVLLKATGGKPINQNSPNRKSPQNPVLKSFKDLIGSSRIGMGKNGLEIMPLVNKLGKFASTLFGSFGPVGEVIGGIVTAGVAVAGAFVEITKAGAELALKFASMQFSMGSTGRETAQLNGLAGALGMSGSDMAGIARGINDKISSDPWARAFAAQMGMHNISGPMGQQDSGKFAITAMEGLRKIADFTERVRMARTIGAEGLLPGTLMGNEQFAKMKADADMQAKIYDPAFQAKAANFQAAAARLATSWTNLLGALARTGIMDRLTNFFNWVADWLEGLAAKFGFQLGGISADRGTGRQPTPGDFGLTPAHSMMGGLEGPDGALKRYADAMNEWNHTHRENADAMRENTDMLREHNRIMKDGRYGRGERADRAFPDSMKGGLFLREAMNAGGIRFSQF